MIISVAMDADIEAARPWVEEANPDFVTLIDQQHLLSSLYNMVNVPQAVWINEDGIIVRPTETGGSLDILREFDFETFSFKPEAAARAQISKSLYQKAVKDWAEKGADSQFVYTADDARARTPAMTADIAEAHAWFSLGQRLKQQGDGAGADHAFKRSRELHPDSWNIFRETSEKLDNGIAGGQEYWEKINAMGDKAYYEPIDMPDMPS
ncbi:MAG: hypothetical protein KDI36_16450 [Pseudomonadales bacterium]|nr:hypothetical protein [Pseudomonadales bacterium]